MALDYGIASESGGWDPDSRLVVSTCCDRGPGSEPLCAPPGWLARAEMPPSVQMQCRQACVAPVGGRGHAVWVHHPPLCTALPTGQRAVPATTHSRWKRCSQPATLMRANFSPVTRRHHCPRAESLQIPEEGV